MGHGLMHGHRADRRADPLNHFRHASGRQEEKKADKEEEEVENQQETNKKPKQKPQELVAQMR